jgi:hypothetical protein
MSRASLAGHPALVFSNACAPRPTRPARARVPRRARCAWLGVSLLGAASKAPTQSYVDRAGLLIVEANGANDFLGKRLDDRELARLVARAAEGWLQAAKGLGWSVPHRP